MDNNKHPHHDLIIEWAKDTRMDFQVSVGTKNPAISKWSDSGIDHVISDALGDCNFRIKPREFIKGHWYPLMNSEGDVCVNIFTGKGFSTYSGGDGYTFSQDDFDDIGKSLGEIKFNE